ncbi:hypothetical protein ACNHG4_12755, partial [Bacillus paralicheniformis]|uniref:hypothetical protein n=1 Tax=Bacillus paralicheniformis TaxID=1648923 RepID=UPI003A8C7D1F
YDNRLSSRSLCRQIPWLKIAPWFLSERPYFQIMKNYKHLSLFRLQILLSLRKEDDKIKTATI